MARRSRVPVVFFPWERRRGLFGVIGRARARLLVGVLVVGSLLWFVHRREENAAAVRATRATLTTAGQAVARYRADHAGGCPRTTGDLLVAGYVRDLPVDAWGRPLRLVCPGRKDALGFDLSSDGPDGLPGGLDRLE
jgi:general secretion pathway protein G